MSESSAGSELRSFRVEDSTGRELLDPNICNSIKIIRDDGMTIEVHGRRTDGFVAIYSGNHTLAVWPRGANVVYVTEEK